MMSLTDFIWFALLAVIVSHWWRSRDAKAFALHYAARRCRELNLQLLDQSIVLRKIRLKPGDGGLLQWHRLYNFEFSSTGVERYPGSLQMAGNRLLSIELAAHVTHDM
jgi:hypothetical protein